MSAAPLQLQRSRSQGILFYYLNGPSQTGKKEKEKKRKVEMQYVWGWKGLACIILVCTSTNSLLTVPYTYVLLLIQAFMQCTGRKRTVVHCFMYNLVILKSEKCM